MSSLLRTLFLLALPFATLQTQVKPGTDLQIVPFNTLPLCAQSCGPLFDVAYSCIPPAKPAADTSCFCKDPRTTAVGTAGAGNTCATACTVAADLTAVQSWYSKLCASGGTTPTNPDGGSTGGTDGSNTGSGDETSGNTGGSTGDDTTVATPKKKSWIEGHYQYVIMIVIIVVAIVGGWIAAAFFRKRYLRKRELNYEMRPPTAPWATGHSGPAGPYGGSGFGDGAAGKEAAMMTTPMTAAQVQKEKKRWFVGERT
ncbi:hypothetical protein V494_08532 [Pseudogymnoascus sp. VKM F-4513 (FW-928)]|nr:hypothetical protein V494_08532 [Pseudogymnoascus sp. VKM F-4513 (FW-928)]